MPRLSPKLPPPQPTFEDGYLSRSDSAAFLAISKKYLDKLAVQGKLHPRYIGRKPVYRKSDLRALAERGAR